MNVDPTFTRAHLIVTSIHDMYIRVYNSVNCNACLNKSQDCTQDEMESVAYTGRQLKSTSASIQLAVHCKLEQTKMLVKSMNKCYDSVEVIYAYNKATPLGML